MKDGIPSGQAPSGDVTSGPTLRARRLRIHTQHEPVVFMRTDCHVCRSEGLASHTQVTLSAGGREILATLYQVEDGFLEPDEAGLSEAAWDRLEIQEGDSIAARHPEPVESLGRVRSRIYRNRLNEADMQSIVGDIAAGRYSDVHLASFITACSAFPLDGAETIALTRAMVDVGDRLAWATDTIADKHSVGGLPGNRTTPLVVAIVAANGLIMPKTSSRAITSPAGTADTMETLAPVDLNVQTIRKVVEAELGCIVWGGAVMLSPADDILIRIERALDLDSEGQLVASVLSKKIAAGSSHLVLDIPVGPTAKVRSREAAGALAARLALVAAAFGIRMKIVESDGVQPVGRGIGPALEARDVLAVLQRSVGAPTDLEDRACTLAGTLMELAGGARPGAGKVLAERTLAEGRAWTKFQRICEAQGGMRVPPVARQMQPLLAERSGRVDGLDNRKLATLAKLAGAPEAKAAGIEMHVRLGDIVHHGEPLCTVHAETRGELDYALAYAAASKGMFGIGVS